MTNSTKVTIVILKEILRYKNSIKSKAFEILKEIFKVKFLFNFTKEILKNAFKKKGKIEKDEREYLTMDSTIVTIVIFQNS